MFVAVMLIIELCMASPILALTVSVTNGKNAVPGGFPVIMVPPMTPFESTVTPYGLLEIVKLDPVF